MENGANNRNGNYLCKVFLAENDQKFDWLHSSRESNKIYSIIITVFIFHSKSLLQNPQAYYYHLNHVSHSLNNKSVENSTTLAKLHNNGDLQFQRQTFPP